MSELLLHGQLLYCFDTAGSASHGNCGIHALLGTAANSQQYSAPHARAFLVDSLRAAKVSGGAAWQNVRASLEQEVAHLFHVRLTGEGDPQERSAADLFFNRINNGEGTIAELKDSYAAAVEANQRRLNRISEAILGDQQVKEGLRMMTLAEPAIGPTLRVAAHAVHVFVKCMCCACRFRPTIHLRFRG